MSFLPLSSKSPSLFAYFLTSIREWLNALEISNRWAARWICRVIPNTCSTGYDLRLFGRTWLHLPSPCSLNPFTEELVDLRFRAADFLFEQTLLEQEA
ncbi:MAG: Mo-dependent nitrogenase C-terminal domain-containing protein [Cyanobacteria bacterium J06621_11]